jgi:hypothetical protein
VGTNVKDMTAIPNVILEAINSLKNTLKNIQEAFN